MLVSEHVTPDMAVACSVQPLVRYGFAIHQTLVVKEGQDMRSNLRRQNLYKVYLVRFPSRKHK